MRRSLLICLVIVLFTASLAAQNYTIQQYLNIKSSTSPTFSADGKKLAYLSNDSGLWQIWMLDIAENKPRMITSYEDNIGFVKWSPAGNGILFGKAHGGDENTQLFWMANNGIEIRELTKEPKVRHNFGAWSEDGKTIYYASNKRNPTYFDIYSMDVATGAEKLIYQNNGNNSVEAVNATGSKIVVSRDGTEFSLDNDLYLIDTDTGKATLLTRHTGASQFGNAAFLPDGKSLILASDDGREMYTLANLRLKNPANSSDWSEKNLEMSFVDGVENDITGIEMAKTPDKIFFVTNKDGFSALWKQDIETDGKPLITVLKGSVKSDALPPNSVISGLTASPDGTKLAFSSSSATSNGDIWLRDIPNKKLVKLTHSDRAGIDPTTFIAPRLITFRSFDGREIPAWFYKPTKAVPVGKVSTSTTEMTITAPPYDLPVIVSVHGGPEGQERPGFNALYQYYLSRGYAILATNVRGSTGYGKTYTHLDDIEKREDSVKDLAYAVEWLKSDRSINSKKIAIMGGSYGGYMTLAAITLYPDLWAAAVDTVGIGNWETFLKNTSGYRRRQREVEYGSLDKNIDFLRSISPIAKIDRIKCPLFVIAGKNDPRVPWTEGQQMVDALKKRGATVEWKLYDDEGHGVAKLKNRLDLYPRVADFLDKFVK